MSSNFFFNFVFLNIKTDTTPRLKYCLKIDDRILTKNNKFLSRKDRMGPNQKHTRKNHWFHFLFRF
jgi:hypothetical protein